MVTCDAIQGTHIYRVSLRYLLYKQTSILQQFVWSEFAEEYRPTDRRETYYPSVVLAERLYELKITDLPTIPYFPVSSHLEWTDFRYYGLRSATAYVLVFDLSNQDTFQVFYSRYRRCIFFDLYIYIPIYIKFAR